uniref:SCP domain-containing protein n=1 Tax=Ornithorhynchus anatinus TaxID=9258 RepID=F7DWI6_ORNAN
MNLRHWMIAEARIVLMTVLVFFTSGKGYKTSPLPDIENEEFIKDCVQMHNKLRSEVNPSSSNMKYMTWDPDLAKTARAWAKTCQFKHNIYLKQPKMVHPSFSSVGENIWTGSLSLFSASSAIQKWYDEVQYYTYETRSCTKVCGHYTQVVWATSYKVGCAVHLCPQVAGFKGLTNGAHFICNYGLAGNYPTWPYKTGKPCSSCDNNENCQDKLCTNSQRDKVTGQSNWAPAWEHNPTQPRSPPPPGHPGGNRPPVWPSPTISSPPLNSSHTACGQGCAFILILRSVFLLLTVGATLLIKWRYPRIFYYK